MSQQPVVAVAWLSEADWPRWQAIDEICAYAKWREKVDHMCAAFRARGLEPVPVPVQPDIFVKWCAATGNKPSTRSRAEFAGRKLAVKIGRHK